MLWAFCSFLEYSVVMVLCFVIGIPHHNIMQCTWSWRVNAAGLWIVSSSGYIYLFQKRRSTTYPTGLFTVLFPFSIQRERLNCSQVMTVPFPSLLISAVCVLSSLVTPYFTQWLILIFLRIKSTNTSVSTKIGPLNCVCFTNVNVCLPSSLPTK